MRSIQLQPPKPFDFRNPDNWLWWRSCFKQFHVASGLSTSPAIQQVSTLLYCIGEEAEAVHNSIGLIGSVQHGSLQVWWVLPGTVRCHTCIWAGTLRPVQPARGRKCQEVYYRTLHTGGQLQLRRPRRWDDTRSTRCQHHQTLLYQNSFGWTRSWHLKRPRQKYGSEKQSENNSKHSTKPKLKQAAWTLKNFTPVRAHQQQTGDN